MGVMDAMDGMAAPPSTPVPPCAPTAQEVPTATCMVCCMEAGCPSHGPNFSGAVCHLDGPRTARHNPDRNGPRPSAPASHPDWPKPARFRALQPLTAPIASSLALHTPAGPAPAPAPAEGGRGTRDGERGGGTCCLLYSCHVRLAGWLELDGMSRSPAQAR